MEHFDVAVVGLGVLGSAAAYQAALRGKKVVAFEQFELGHVRGASHDTSRIVRTANASPQYVSLAKSAYGDWANLEKATDQKLLTITGGVMFFPEGATPPRVDYTTSLDTKNVPYEVLDSNQVNKRWPQFNIPRTVETVYTADTGIAHAAKTVLAMQSLARTNGALLKEHTRVDRVTPKKSGMGVVIETSKGQFHAAKVILTTDAWTNKLLAPLGAHIPLTVMQEQVTYFKLTDEQAWEPGRFPVWIWGGDPCFYGFPSFGEPTIKVARDTSNNLMTPEQRTYVHSPQLLEQLCSFMGNFIPTRAVNRFVLSLVNTLSLPIDSSLLVRWKSTRILLSVLGLPMRSNLHLHLVVLLRNWQLMGGVRRIFRGLGFRIILLLLADFKIFMIYDGWNSIPGQCFHQKWPIMQRDLLLNGYYNIIPLHEGFG